MIITVTNLFLSFIVFLVILYLLPKFFPNLINPEGKKVFYLVLIFYLTLTGYLFTKDIVIKNIEERVPNSLKVFDHPTYKVDWQDFPTYYFNPYYQKNMDLNASDFYWSSSRKSYLAVGESWDFPSYEAIQKVLEKGARVINLDIYSQQTSPLDPDAVPVVRNETINILAKPLEFKKCLQTIREYAWKYNADYPLVLYLEIKSDDKSSNGKPIYNKFFLYKMAQNIMEVFSDKLINKIYGFNGRDNKFTFGTIPMKSLLGNVAIITNVYPTVGIFDEIIHGVANEDQQFVKVIPYSDINKNYGGLRSTFQDKQSLIQHNYKYISIVDPVANTSIFNFLEPKDDIYNIPPNDPWSFGCQMVLMNFQLYDEHMQDYIKKFKKSALIIKPNELRYIPRPPIPIKKQDPQMYYVPRKLVQPGWFNQNI